MTVTKPSTVATGIAVVTGLKAGPTPKSRRVISSRAEQTCRARRDRRKPTERDD